MWLVRMAFSNRSYHLSKALWIFLGLRIRGYLGGPSVIRILCADEILSDRRAISKTIDIPHRSYARMVDSSITSLAMRFPARVGLVTILWWNSIMTPSNNFELIV